jgi:hypothetical protein
VRLEAYGYFEVPETGLFNFTIGADDGMNITIDGDDHLEFWKAGPPYKQIFRPRFLRAGGHVVGVEMF